MNNFLLVISHYNSRPKNLLKKLIESTENLKIDRLIVINDDHVKKNNLTKYHYDGNGINVINICLKLDQY